MKEGERRLCELSVDAGPRFGIRCFRYDDFVAVSDDCAKSWSDESITSWWCSTVSLGWIYEKMGGHSFANL